MPHFVFIQVAIACDDSVLCSEEMYISPLGDFSFDALTSMVPPKGGGRAAPFSDPRRYGDTKLQ
jgi:hypothetical protein